LTGGVFEAGFPSEKVKEGRIQVLVPRLKAYATQPSVYAPSKAPVFYNPAMEFNRDLSVIAVQVYQRITKREISVCEPLTSSGVRGVRFAAEVTGIKSVLIGDINERAVTLSLHNVQLNNQQERVTVVHVDANSLLSCCGAPHKRFDVVDIDPFGSPVPYLDSAIRALRDGGLLAVTATDLAPLCGVHSRACIRKYGGKPLRTEYCHELAVRLLTGCVATLAGKHDIGINVVFSHSTDHYVRVYAQIAYGARRADESIKTLGYVLHCFHCLHRETLNSPFSKRIEACPECGSKMDFAGPMWLGKILEKQFCESMKKDNNHRALGNSTRITKLLDSAIDEAESPPTFYVLDKISGKLSLPVPSLKAIIEALNKGGPKTTKTHFNSRGFKTDASVSDIEESIRSLAAATSPQASLPKA
jgi:tRNA (guanine26-N2/guanine27-N2)-dimethyltransferase